MLDFVTFLPYLVMAGVTYLVRMAPLVLVRKKFENKFFLSFLYYVPFVVLGVMTVPAVFFSTGSLISAAVGFCVALLAAFFERSLITVASAACFGVLITELIEKFI